MATQTAQINPDGSAPQLEIRFGHANIGVYRIYRWETAAHSIPIARGNNLSDPVGRVSLGAPSGLLTGATIGFEAIVQSTLTGPGQPYSVVVEIRQDNAIVPGGVFSGIGKLNDHGAKSVIGFITFEHFQQL